MARKALDSQLEAAPELAPEFVERDREVANTIAALEAGYSDERDLANQLLGQAQMAGAFEEFSRTVRTSKLAFVKENKLYRALKGKKSPHGAEFLAGTWEEFCGLLGRSVDQVDRDIANLRTFGEEALESMSRMGIGYRELRQYRRLPEDQKAALIEVAKIGDKDSFLELAEDLIAKHSREKEGADAKIADLEATLAARDKVLSKKSEHADQLATQLERLRAGSPDELARAAAERDLQVAKTLQDAALALLGYIQRYAVAVADALSEPTEARETLAHETTRWLFQQLAEITQARGWMVDFQDTVQPAWVEQLTGSVAGASIPAEEA